MTAVLGDGFTGAPRPAMVGRGGRAEAAARSAATAPVALGTDAPVVVRRHGWAPGADPASVYRVLLMHGLASSSLVWEDVMAHGSAWADLWSADLPWRGAGVADWYHQEDTGAWMDLALRGVPGGAGVVVAHSFSAVQLLSLLDREITAGVDPVARYGIRALVLVAPFYRADPAEFTWGNLTRYLDDFHRVMEEGVGVRARRPLDPEIQAHMARRVCERVGPYGWSRFLTSYLRTPWLRVRDIDVPTLIVCGAQDQAVSPMEGSMLAAGMPRAELTVLPHCGHFLMAEQPGTFAGLVEDFLRRTLPTGTTLAPPEPKESSP